MNVTELLNNEDRAVSPVIGVILMVAITVILAAVIGTFVLGLGDQVQTTAPNTQFSFDYDSSAGDLTVTHDGGDAIKASQLSFSGASSLTWTDAGGDASGSNSRVVAGDSATLSGITDSDTLRVVWQSESGDSSSTVARWSGPDA